MRFALLGFPLTEHRGFLGGTARVFYPQMDTDYADYFEGQGWPQVAGREQKHCSAVSREGAKTRRLEGECPHEPPSAAREDGLRFLKPNLVSPTSETRVLQLDRRVLDDLRVHTFVRHIDVPPDVHQSSHSQHRGDQVCAPVTHERQR